MKAESKNVMKVVPSGGSHDEAEDDFEDLDPDDKDDNKIHTSSALSSVTSSNQTDEVAVVKQINMSMQQKLLEAGNSLKLLQQEKDILLEFIQVASLLVVHLVFVCWSILIFLRDIYFKTKGSN
jgi:hypothetical protein